MEASRSERSLDLQLSRDACNGVLAAWHEFVERYSSVIAGIGRRYLADFDEDARRDAYVDTLEYMRSSGLALYDGRAALSTWVMAIARSRALDLRRAMCGRRRDPVWLAAMRGRDHDIFHLYFEGGEGISEIRQRFAARGERVSAQEVVESLDRLEARMDRRLRTRLAYDLQARTVGAASGGFLAFLDQVRLEQLTAMEALRPDLELSRRETEQLLDAVESVVRQLDAEDRTVVEMHFYRHWSARRIAQELRLQSPRRAYSRIGRAVARLRQALEARSLEIGLDDRQRQSKTGGTR